MRAQVILTPAESKRLIAKAVARLDAVRRALGQGTVVLHPGSSNYFIVEELVGHPPKTDVWACGVIAPKGLCIEMGMSATVKVKREFTGAIAGGGDDYLASWVIRKGTFSTGETLKAILKEMRADDVYVKGANALDPEGHVGVLVGGDSVENVTIGRVLAARRRAGFHMVFPTGLEKVIPIAIGEAAKEARSRKVDYSMGQICTLLPCDGIVVSEPRAIGILSGAMATPIAAGGLGGAEGAVVLAIRGDDEQVRTAIDFVEQCKGARLPALRLASCHDCFNQSCPFPVGNKTWGW